MFSVREIHILMYNAVSLLDTPEDSFIDSGIICKHMLNILHGESILPNPCLYLIFIKIDQHSGIFLGH